MSTVETVDKIFFLSTVAKLSEWKTCTSTSEDLVAVLEQSLQTSALIFQLLQGLGAQQGSDLAYWEAACGGAERRVRKTHVQEYVCEGSSSSWSSLRRRQQDSSWCWSRFTSLSDQRERLQHHQNHCSCPKWTFSSPLKRSREGTFCSQKRLNLAVLSKWAQSPKMQHALTFTHWGQKHTASVKSRCPQQPRQHTAASPNPISIQHLQMAFTASSINGD